MEYVYLLGEILLVLALVGFVVVLIWLAMTALRLKTAAVTNAGRLYKRPLNAGKNLVTTGRGIVQQETVRVKHMGASVKSAAGAVKETAVHVKASAQAVHPQDLKPALATMQNMSKIIRLAAQFSRPVHDEGPH